MDMNHTLCRDARTSTALQEKRERERGLLACLFITCRELGGLSLATTLDHYYGFEPQEIAK